MYRSFYSCRKSKKFSPISSSKFLSRRRIFVSTFFILAVLKLELLVCVCVYQSFATLLCTETLLYLQRQQWYIHLNTLLLSTLHVDARIVSVGIFYSRRKYGSRWLCSSSLNSISLGNRYCDEWPGLTPQFSITKMISNENV